METTITFFVNNAIIIIITATMLTASIYEAVSIIKKRFANR